MARRIIQPDIDAWAEANIYNQPSSFLTREQIIAPYVGDQTGISNLQEMLDDANSVQAASTLGNPKTLGGLKGFFAKYKNALGSGKIPNIQTLNANALQNYGTGWTKKGGIQLMGGNVGKLATGAGALVNAVKSIKSINENDDITSDSKDLISKIRASASGNPMLSSYLTPDQMSQLNKLKRGYVTEDNNTSMFNNGMLTGALKGGATGLATGGIPGLIIGAIGGGASGGLQHKTSQLQSRNSELEGLYQSLQDADAQYKRMRIPNYTGLGLQSRYTNQWM